MSEDQSSSVLEVEMQNYVPRQTVLQNDGHNVDANRSSLLSGGASANDGLLQDYAAIKHKGDYRGVEASISRKGNNSKYNSPMTPSGKSTTKNDSFLPPLTSQRNIAINTRPTQSYLEPAVDTELQDGLQRGKSDSQLAIQSERDDKSNGGCDRDEGHSNANLLKQQKQLLEAESEYQPMDTVTGKRDLDNANLNTLVSVSPTKLPKDDQIQSLEESEDLTREVKFNIVQRKLLINDQINKKSVQHFSSNKIRTARYNVFTFVPIALLVQYTKIGNVFWTIQMILQFSAPTLRTQNPFLVMLLVVAIVTLGMVKEFLSDYKRVRADKQTNNAEHKYLASVRQFSDKESALNSARRHKGIIVNDLQNPGQQFSYYTGDVLCQDIKVGDLLVLNDGMIVPADCILIKTLSDDTCECQV